MKGRTPVNYDDSGGNCVEDAIGIIVGCDDNVGSGKKNCDQNIL